MSSYRNQGLCVYAGVSGTRVRSTAQNDQARHRACSSTARQYVGMQAARLFAGVVSRTGRDGRRANGRSCTRYQRGGNRNRGVAGDSPSSASVGPFATEQDDARRWCWFHHVSESKGMGDAGDPPLRQSTCRESNVLMCSPACIAP